MYVGYEEANEKGIKYVYCNGVQLERCCGFDVDNGYADTLKFEDGKYVIDKDKEEVVIDRHYGLISLVYENEK